MADYPDALVLLCHAVYFVNRSISRAIVHDDDLIDEGDLCKHSQYFMNPSGFVIGRDDRCNRRLSKIPGFGGLVLGRSDGMTLIPDNIRWHLMSPPFSDYNLE
jgi:hypothetical protein